MKRRNVLFAGLALNLSAGCAGGDEDASGDTEAGTTDADSLGDGDDDDDVVGDDDDDAVGDDDDDAVGDDDDDAVGDDDDDVVGDDDDDAVGDDDDDSVGDDDDDDAVGGDDDDDGEDDDRPTGECWQAELMFEPDADPSNSAYPDPEVSWSCGTEDFQVQSNGIPGFRYVAVTPNPLAAQNFDWSIPKEPELAASPTEVPLLGLEAFSLNGLPIYGPNEGPFPDPWGDPIYNEVVDYCMGHTGGMDDYHYHALLVSCIFGVEDDGVGPSPILGFAVDGFPIYGPRGCLDDACTQVVEFESGWEAIGDPTTNAWDAHVYVEGDEDTRLDQCNGRVGPDGTYRYHATSSFPYVLGCFSGTPSDSAGDGGPMMP